MEKVSQEVKRSQHFKNLKSLLKWLFIIICFIINIFSYGGDNKTIVLNNIKYGPQDYFEEIEKTNPSGGTNNDNNNQTEKKVEITPKTYISDDNYGYSSTTPLNLRYGRLSSFYINLGIDGEYENDYREKTPIIKIKNSASVKFDFKTPNIKSGDNIVNYAGNLDSVWKLQSDTWGSTQVGNKTEQVNTGHGQLTVGEIGTGALVIQKSYDGSNYYVESQGRYGGGLYTTDYISRFSGYRTIFTPSGDDIKRGVYYSISIFYETKAYIRTIERKERGKIIKEDIYEISNNRETYEFKIVEENEKAVTFNNLTINNREELVTVVKPTNTESEEYQSQLEQYENYVTSFIDRVSETMTDNSLTTTGFRINVTTNPNINIIVQKNGNTINKVLQKSNGMSYYEFKDSGKYDITVGTNTKKTIYVDNYSPDAAYEKYFGRKKYYNGNCYGDEFLNYSPDNPYRNKRIFDPYSDVPVFANSITLKLKDITQFNVPLYGIITNKSSGNTREYPLGGIIKLDSPGTYEIAFYTSKDYYEKAILGNDDASFSGDVRRFIFKFKIKAVDGKSSVNKELLTKKSFLNYSIVSPSDYKPRFYGVSRTSSGKGRIIIAFHNKDAALDYAKDVVMGDIEGPFSDSSNRKYWMIPNVNNPLQKIRSYSGWTNANTVKELSKSMVEECYFDLTDTNSYLTLDKTVYDFQEEGEDVFKLNLSSLTIHQTVIVWYNKEERESAIVNLEKDTIPFVGKSSISVLQKEGDSYVKVNLEEKDFYFVKDYLGIESYIITITDSNNKSFTLDYEKGLVEQLQYYNCSSGIITIKEKNIYGVTNTYELFFIDDGYQPAEIILSSDDEIIEDYNKKYNRVKVEDIINYIDPYCFIKLYIISPDNNLSLKYYTIDEIIAQEFDIPAQYELSIIDRYGNSKTVKFEVEQ